MRPWGGISLLSLKLGPIKISAGISSNGPYLTVRPTKITNRKKKDKTK